MPTGSMFNRKVAQKNELWLQHAASNANRRVGRPARRCCWQIFWFCQCVRLLTNLCAASGQQQDDSAPEQSADSGFGNGHQFKRKVVWRVIKPGPPCPVNDTAG